MSNKLGQLIDAAKNGSLREPDYYRTRDENWLKTRAGRWKLFCRASNEVTEGAQALGVVIPALMGIYGGWKSAADVDAWYRFACYPVFAVGGGIVGIVAGALAAGTIEAAKPLFKDNKASGYGQGLLLGFSSYLTIMVGQFYNSKYVPYGAPAIPLIDKVTLPYGGSAPSGELKDNKQAAIFNVGGNEFVVTEYRPQQQPQNENDTNFRERQLARREEINNNPLRR